jgi:hypothetical protein
MTRLRTRLRPRRRCVILDCHRGRRIGDLCKSHASGQSGQVGCHACPLSFKSTVQRSAHERWNHPATPEIIAERERAYRASHRRQRFISHANEKARHYGLSGRIAIDAELPPGPCAYCGGPANSWDHIDPMGRGGPNTIVNLAPACLPCNQHKHLARVAS